LRHRRIRGGCGRLHRASLYRLRDKNPEFRDAWQRAEAMIINVRNIAGQEPATRH
jgi:hypothetical protein